MILLERQTQLEQLARQLREAGAGSGKLAFIGGEAGAGKSTLVDQFAQQVAGTATVVWSQCDALQTSRVLGPVYELLTALSPSGTARQLSELTRAQLFADLFNLLSSPKSLYIAVIEDLHWADEATLDFLRFLGRRIQRSRCLLIGTYRDDELTPSHALRSVLGELTGSHAMRMHVPTLSFDAVRELAQNSERDPQQIYQVTNGNPFFVRELLSAPSGVVPETVRDAVLARLTHCSAAARELAELVSLIPGKTETWLVREILGEGGIAAAGEAVACGLLRDLNQSLAYRHELGRLAVASAVPGERAQAQHQSILRILSAHEADLSRLVHHAVHAQDVTAILQYAPRAAQQATLATGHREAAAHLATALRHCERLSIAESARLFEWHAKECSFTNEASASLDSGAEALGRWRQLGDVASQARVLLLMSFQFWKSGRTVQANQHVHDAITLLEARPPGHELAMAYSVRSQRAMTAHEPAAALAYGRRALDLATELGDEAVRAHALNNIGATLFRTGDESGLTLLQQSLAVSLAHNLQEHAARAYSNLVSKAVDQRLNGLVARYLTEGAEYCSTHDVHDGLSYIRAYGTQWALNAGLWDRAAHEAAELLGYHTLAIAQRIPTLLTLAQVRTRRGDPGAGILLDESARLAMATGEMQRIVPVAAARAEDAWYRGDLAAAAHEAEAGLKATAGQHDRWLVGPLAYWGWRGNSELELPSDIAEPFALMIAGNWQEAASLWERLEMPYEQALALADGPESALRESLVISERLGAGPLTAILRHRLRELGARGIPRGPRSSTLANPSGLTSREVQVLTLLVHGHTNSQLANRMHVSAKTIEHHVSSILEKLGVRSRTEAVAAAFGLGIIKAGATTSSLSR